MQPCTLSIFFQEFFKAVAEAIHVLVLAFLELHSLLILPCESLHTGALCCLLSSPRLPTPVQDHTAANLREPEILSSPGVHLPVLLHNALPQRTGVEAALLLTAVPATVLADPDPPLACPNKL